MRGVEYVFLRAQIVCLISHTSGISMFSARRTVDTGSAMRFLQDFDFVFVFFHFALLDETVKP